MFIGLAVTKYCKHGLFDLSYIPWGRKNCKCYLAQKCRAEISKDRANSHRLPKTGMSVINIALFKYLKLGKF